MTRYTLLSVASLLLGVAAIAAPPTDNPAARYGAAAPEWLAGLKWANVRSVQDAKGESNDAKVASLQDELAKLGGGVIYFPPGTYAFSDTIKLKNGIILRGDSPAKGATDADFAPPATLVFPRYKLGAENSTAFKGVELEDEVGGKQAGVIALGLESGHISLGTYANFTASIVEGKRGGEYVVMDCKLRGAAILDAAIPMATIPKTQTPFQLPWQRWTHRHHAAINIFCAGKAFVAGNRIANSAEYNFMMKGYKLVNNTADGQWLKAPEKLKIEEQDVLFDYDNRPGISVNYLGLRKELALFGPYKDAIKDGKPLPDADSPINAAPPAGRAKEIVIRDNFVYCTGGAGIRAGGDGVKVLANTIRFEPNVIRPTARGYQVDHFTNNNRAIEIRGWGWSIEGNDYVVHSNLSLTKNRDGSHRIYGDGEGIMHEAYENVSVVNSRLVNNKGNAYLCIWRVPVKNLLIQGNQVDAIRVLCGTKEKDAWFACENLLIADNKTGWTPMGPAAGMYGKDSIVLEGRVSTNALVRNNEHLGSSAGVIRNDFAATLQDNKGYAEPTTKPKAK